MKSWTCILFAVWGLTGWLASGADVRADAPETPLDFAHDVVPILKRHCADCHGGKESKGGFSINTRGLILDADVVDSRNPEQSRLMELLRSVDPDDQMPPADRPRLGEIEIAVLARWIAEDLPWESGYTFAKSTYEPPLQPRRPALPDAIEQRDHPIDRIVDAYLTEHQQTPPVPLEDRQFLRRVSLDLLGVLPPPEQIERFVASVEPDKRAQMIDELLRNEEGYATHWLTFWNDLLRNAYSGTGYIDGGRKSVTKFLYGALVRNMAYDEFVRQLIAPSPESEGFIRGIKWRGDVNASQTGEIQFAQSVSQVFLGINLKCASCHDSFIDRWTLDETYGLAAIYSDHPLELHRCDKPQGRNAEAAWIFPELGQIDAAAPPAARLKQLSVLMTHPQNGRLARTVVNRLWHRTMGRGIVHPVDAMHTPPWNADLLDYLAVYLVDQSYDLKQVLRHIVTSAAYQSHAVVLDAELDSEAFVYAGPIARRLTAEQFVDAVWSVTRTWPTPDESLFKRDGRHQNGQLRDVLLAISNTADSAELTPEVLAERWGQRSLRAAFTALDSLQAQLGRPIREQVVSSRPTDLTTLQAITLANGPELSDLLQRGAASLVAEAKATDQDRDDFIRDVFVALLTRPPTDVELQTSREMLGSGIDTTSVEDLLWSVLMLPEFQIIR